MILLKENSYDHIHNVDFLIESFREDINSINIISSIKEEAYILEADVEDAKKKSIISTIMKWGKKIKDFITRFFRIIREKITELSASMKKKRMKEKSRDMGMGTLPQEINNKVDEILSGRKVRDIEAIIKLHDEFDLKQMDSYPKTEEELTKYKDSIVRMLTDVGMKRTNAEMVFDKNESILASYDDLVPMISIDHTYMSSSDCMIKMDILTETSKKFGKKYDEINKDMDDMVRNIKRVDPKETAIMIQGIQKRMAISANIINMKATMLKDGIGVCSIVFNAWERAQTG